MKSETFDLHEVLVKAQEMRIDIIEMLAFAGSGHPGGSLSSTEVVATLFFGGVLRYNPADSQDPARDRFVLSKGHVAPVLYAALAGAGMLDRKEFETLRHLGGMLQGHPDRLKTPGVEVSTGSLGQGLSVACGMAQGLKLDGGDQKVYALLGDGELQEGQTWEAIMYAAHYKIDNLIAIVDRNGLQIDGETEKIMSLGDVASKFRAFGWDAIEVNGHSPQQIYNALTTPMFDGMPRVIVANTSKGKGVSFMDGKAEWHGNAPSREQADIACAEIGSCFIGEDE